MRVVRVRVARQLELFLRPGAAGGVVQVRCGPTDSVGHVVQSAGVPLTEVGRLEVGGGAVTPSARLVAGDVVDVEARPRPQPLDGPPLLLLDVHLGALARRLRLLGIDAAYCNDAGDEELVGRAAREDRLLLTRDRRLLQRRALRRAAYVRGDSPDDQLRDVLDRFELPLAPYTRCLVCGGTVRAVDKSDVLDRLRPGTRRTQQEFGQCGDCGQVYWSGAHAGRLEEIVLSGFAARAARGT